MTAAWTTEYFNLRSSQCRMGHRVHEREDKKVALIRL